MASKLSLRSAILAAALAVAGIVPAAAGAATDGTSNTVLFAESVARPGTTAHFNVVFSDILVTSLADGGHEG